MKEKYSKENLEKIVKESFSVADVIRKLGMSPRGTNYETIKKYINLYNLDTNHFTGKAWNRNKAYTELTARVPLSDILNKDVAYSSSTLLKRLVKAQMKEYKCECCGCSDVVLELHHINGDHFDNRIENLQILCPNCHSKTDNYKKPKHSIVGIKEGRRLGKTIPNICICENCGKEFTSDRKTRKRRFCCRECYNEFLRKPNNLGGASSVMPSKEELTSACKLYNNLNALGKHFEISRTSIRKLLIKYDLYETFKLKYDFHSKKVIQHNLNGEEIKTWPSIVDAAESLNICKNSIGKCIHGKRRSAGGYLWTEV